MLTAGSKQVSIVVQNITDSAIFLKRGAHVMHVVSATLVPPVEAPWEEEQGVQMSREWLSVQEQQKKLLDKLNLDGLSEWSPCNAAIVRELLLCYHDTFVLKSDKLGCTSTIKHEICLNVTFDKVHCQISFIKPSTDSEDKSEIPQKPQIFTNLDTLLICTN